MRDQVTAIAFQGGAYGQYLKWILYYLTHSEDIVPPWKANGNSHAGRYLLDPKFGKQFDQNLQEIDGLSLFTIHPVRQAGDRFIDNLKVIEDSVDRVVVPYADNATYLLAIHNYMYKIWDDLEAGPLRHINRQDLLNGWGVATNVPLADIEPWILREFFSEVVFDSWEDQCEWFAPGKYKSDKVYWIFLTDLLYNFMPAIERLRAFLDIEWVRDPHELIPFHRQNLSQQMHLDQDQLAHSIITSLRTNKNLEWNGSSLTIFTEAFIQRKLKDQGILLQCNGLNVFPESTAGLIQVLE